MKKLSKEACQVLSRLSAEEKKSIRRDNPLKRDRDAAVVLLRQRGVKQRIIHEISGIPISTISRICLKATVNSQKLKAADVMRLLRKIERHLRLNAHRAE